MNLYEILEQLRKKKIPVFTTNDISRISHLKKSSAIVYIKRMVDKGLIFRVTKGIYALDPDPFLYASYIIPNSYISFNAALYINKVIDQVPSTIHVAVPRRVKKKVDGLTFIHFPKKALFGYTQIEYKGYFIWVADKEKALVDITYKFGHISQSYEMINKNKFKRYAKQMGLNLSEVELK
jgi:predicted transcriptional regulator of viral defense system